MKQHFTLPFLFLLIFFLLRIPANSGPLQGIPPDPGYRILIPTGIEKNKFPLLKPLPADDPRFEKSTYLFEKTFISESVRLYSLLQQYLVNSGEKKEIEPAFLLLSGRQGGFPMLGFYLSDKGMISDKRNTWYIDMAALDKNAATLSSMTQIFPHEMGHVFFSLLAPVARKDYDASSTDMHYFSVTTNYLTAFNEGFAEHIENASRLYEQNPTIKEGIEEDTRKLSDRLPRKINGLDKDFRCPLRLGYYRAGLLLWYQPFEDYKRYQWALAGTGMYRNKSLSSGNSEKNILYRNTGLGAEDRVIRNSAQIASNEGIINIFFTRLLQQEMKLGFQPRPFYLPFFPANDTAGFTVGKRVTPLENYYLKIFTVLHRQMNHAAGDTSFLQLFIISWERQFPQEKTLIEKVYQDATGTRFNLHPVPEIWLMNDHQKHSFLVMDQYGGNTVPFYTMNLNSADETDLSGFPGIPEQEIINLIQYRDKNFGFQSLGDLNKAGISQNTIKMLVTAHQLLNKPLKEEDGLSIANIFIYNGGHILLMGLFYFVVFWILFYLVFLRNKYSSRKILLISVQKFLKFYLLILSGLACFIFFPVPVLPFLGLVTIILVTDWFKSRNNNGKRREVILTTLLLGSIVAWSLV